LLNGFICWEIAQARSWKSPFQVQIGARMPTNEELKGETAGHLLKIMSFSTPRRSKRRK